MTRVPDLTPRSSYSAMGKGRHDYEACCAYDEEWGLGGLHCHDFFEFYIHFHGAKHYFIDNKVYPIDVNHLMVIPPFRMHGLLGDQIPHQYDRCFLYISPVMLKSCSGGQLDLDTYITQSTQSGVYQYRMTDQEAQTCKMLMKALLATQESTSAVVRFDNYAKIVQFLSIICQVLSRSSEVVEPIVVNEAMQEVLAYVNKHYTSAVKLESLARQFGVSVSFLSHEFVKYTGRSVYDYVLYRRVLLAKEMINSVMPLGEVAYQCGFNDYSSFLRAFTKLSGMSPSAYRKAIRQSADRG